MSFFAAAAAGTSVKFETQGQEFLGQIAGPVTEVQDTVFGTKDLKFWPDKTPAMKALIPLQTESGDVQTLHVPKGSRLYKAIGVALQAAGAGDLEQGGLLGITWTGFAAGRNPSNPPKDYSARYITAADVAAQAA